MITVQNLIIQLRIVKLKHYSHFNVVLKCRLLELCKRSQDRKKTTLSTDAGGEPEAMNHLGLNPWACHSVHSFSSCFGHMVDHMTRSKISLQEHNGYIERFDQD